MTGPVTPRSHACQAGRFAVHRLWTKEKSYGSVCDAPVANRWTRRLGPDPCSATGRSCASPSRLRRPRRRAALPARRLRDRRPARHRRSSPASASPAPCWRPPSSAVRLPRLRHHGRRRPPGRRRRPALGAARRASTACGSRCCSAPCWPSSPPSLGRAARRGVRRLGRGDAVRRRPTCGSRARASPRCSSCSPATGVLRGLQDTRTPLVVATSGPWPTSRSTVTLVYGAGLGIAGSASGTVTSPRSAWPWRLTASWSRARAGAHGASLRPARRGRSGPRPRPAYRCWSAPLALRAALLAATSVAAAARHRRRRRAPGRVHRLDPARARARRPGHRRPGDRRPQPRRRRRRRRPGRRPPDDAVGLVSGVAARRRRHRAAAAVRAAVHPRRRRARRCCRRCWWWPPVPAGRGVVFVLDGVLIGAGDGRYLALARAS